MENVYITFCTYTPRRVQVPRFSFQIPLTRQLRLQGLGCSPTPRPTPHYCSRHSHRHMMLPRNEVSAVWTKLYTCVRLRLCQYAGGKSWELVSTILAVLPYSVGTCLSPCIINAFLARQLSLINVFVLKTSLEDIVLIVVSCCGYFLSKNRCIKDCQVITVSSHGGVNCNKPYEIRYIWVMSAWNTCTKSQMLAITKHGNEDGHQI